MILLTQFNVRSPNDRVELTADCAFCFILEPWAGGGSRWRWAANTMRTVWHIILVAVAVGCTPKSSTSTQAAAGTNAPVVSVTVKSVHTVSLEWFVHLEGGGDDLVPAGTVYLSVDTQRVALFHSSQWVSTHLVSDEYEKEGVPAIAISAFAGVWKHQRDQLYVTRSGAALFVYHRSFDDRYQRPAFHPIKRIDLNQEQPNEPR